MKCTPHRLVQTAIAKVNIIWQAWHMSVVAAENKQQLTFAGKQALLANPWGSPDNPTALAAIALTSSSTPSLSNSCKAD